ncbi:MAG: hypothetical protein R3C05_21550 [Pirellulaceae bacterium]
MTHIHHSFLRDTLCVCVILIASFQTIASAQVRGFNQELKLQPNVAPAFHVSPMSHRLEASRGKTIPITFEIESVDRATLIQVRTVSLRQEPDGTIMPDTDADPPEDLQLLSESRIELDENEKTTIACEVRVPSTKANFHSFGLLVTDLGRLVDQQPLNAGDNTSRRVGIRFVTRYLLRVDVTVKGSRGEDATNIEIESCELLEENGFAKARAWISNPTESPLEFQVRGTLLRDGDAVGKNEFSLVMPNRAAVDSEDRFDVRILPGARLRVEEMLPEAVFPGDHEIEIALITNRRTRKRASFPISIQAGDFPAQDATIIQAARDVTVAPSQVELSLRRGGDRRAAVEIQNHSPHEMHVRVLPNNNESFVDGLVVRPTELTVRAGSKRKFLLSLDARQSDDIHRYTQLQVTVQTADRTEVGTFEIPVAVLARTEQLPNLVVQPLRWDATSEPPAFVAPIRNEGQMHLPLNAQLKMVDAFGRIVEMKAGYGRWLLPEKATELRFRTQFAPPPGKYRYQLKIDGTDDVPPLELEGELNFNQDGETTVEDTQSPSETSSLAS